ncbi:MAG: nuclear transport factor 2 family protein [Pseudomonadota bacterium]
MNNIIEDVQELFDQYLDCWNKRDLEGVAACFDEPSMFVLPTGAVSSPDRQSLVSLLEKVFAGLEAAGFSHTTIGSVDATPCGDGLAIVDAAEVNRVKKDGSLLEKIDGHYVMRNCDGEWRLIVAVSCASGWRTS